MLEKFGKKVVEHLPEILTIGACVGVIAGDVLLVKGAKKETQDGKKTHYIPGDIASGVGVACIIALHRIEFRTHKKLLLPVRLLHWLLKINLRGKRLKLSLALMNLGKWTM